MKEIREVELIIIGGGPAGMTAAVYAAHSNIKTALLEESVTGGLVNSTFIVQNFPSYRSIHGMELMEKMRDHVDGLEVEVEEVCEIERLELKTDPKVIETDELIYKAKAVILATGRKPIPLDVPVECEQVHYCAICDGGPYKGKRVIVVGGGNSAFDESQYMLKIGIEHITIIEVMDRFFAAQSAQEDLLSTGKVTAHTNTKMTDLIIENDILKSVIVEDVKTGTQKKIDVDGVFVFIGQHPNNELFKDQVKLEKDGYIKANADMSTNIPGVFSAGDISSKLFRQITTAMSDGTVAALSVERYIRGR